jgi:hypothetical protein
MSSNYIKYLIWFLIAATILGGLYLIYQYYQKNAKPASAPSPASPGVSGSTVIPNATNSLQEPIWANVKINKTRAEAANDLLQINQSGQEILVLQRWLNSLLPAAEKLKYDGVFGNLTEKALVKYTQKKTILFGDIPDDFYPPNFFKS